MPIRFSKHDIQVVHHQLWHFCGYSPGLEYFLIYHVNIVLRYVIFNPCFFLWLSSGCLRLLWTCSR